MSARSSHGDLAMFPSSVANISGSASNAVMRAWVQPLEIDDADADVRSTVDDGGIVDLRIESIYSALHDAAVRGAERTIDEIEIESE
jgi:hypothetical protein